jgi:alkylation response protein AidB-like acyl-CoA dehydrogenase
MDFDFSTEQEQLRDSVRRYLQERAPLSYVREQWNDPVGTTDVVWQGLVDLGATGLLAPTALGGTDAGMVTAGVVVEELGRVVHPGPYISSAIAVPTLLKAAGRVENRVDLVDELLTGTADGSRRAAIVGGRATSVSATADGRLSGTEPWVADGGAVDTFVVVAGIDATNARAIFLAAAADATVSPIETVDGTRSFAVVTFDSSPSTPLVGGHVDADVARALDVTNVASVVDGVGTAARAMELAVEYAGQRHQFGKPIGSFQAIQHLCADMLVDLELGRAGAYYALWAADEWLAGRDADGSELHRAATMAKAWASDALLRVAASAIQVFGGIGFTWEHDIHLFYKRLLTLQHVGGGTTQHLEVLAALLLDRPLQGT